jgi:hypothetical protein
MGEQAVVPSLVDKKRGESKMTPCLAALVKWVAELYIVGLRACHYVEEFILRWIRPLGHQEKLAYDSQWLADPSREPATGKMFNLYFYY